MPRGLLQCLAHGHLQLIEIEQRPSGPRTHHIGPRRQGGCLFGHNGPQPAPQAIPRHRVAGAACDRIGQLRPGPLRVSHEAHCEGTGWTPAPGPPELLEGVARTDPPDTTIRGTDGSGPAAHTDRRWRPFARRALITARPFHTSTSFLVLDRGL